MREEKLQALGRIGWEVCGNVGIWLFKRQIQPNANDDGRQHKEPDHASR